MYIHACTRDIPTVQIFALLIIRHGKISRLNFEQLLYKNISRSKISQTTVVYLIALHFTCELYARANRRSWHRTCTIESSAYVACGMRVYNTVVECLLILL